MIPLNYNLPADKNRKRPFEEYGTAQLQESKRLVGVSFLRLCVNSKSTGFIIGKGGCGIDELRVGLCSFL